MIVGNPDEVKQKLNQLVRNFGTDEIVVATFAEEQEDRFKSYELLAKAFNLYASISDNVEVATV